MSSKLCRFNKGFSLVDLLIVIAIVGILAAVLLPSLRINRDGGSRRTACLNNIRNISLACVSYEMTNQQFPAAVSSHSESFLVRILPMLDQNPLYDDFRSEPDKNLAIEILAGVEIEIFRCAAAAHNDFASSDTGFTSHYTGSAGPASSNTLDKYGSAEFSYQTNNFGPVGLRGLFSPTIIDGADPSNAVARKTKSGVIAEHVSDGLSNTLAIVETSRSDFFNNGGRTFTNRRPRWSWGLEEAEPTKVNWSRSIARTINSFDDVPHQEIPYHELPISSNHLGGANVSSGDGSTHFVSEDTDLIVLQAVGGIDEGDKEHQNLYQ